MRPSQFVAKRLSATETTYGLCGQTPVVPGTGQRFGCNLISAITNRGHVCFSVFREQFDADVFLTFLARLVQHAQRRVFLIVDRHPVHRSKKVRVWLEEHANEIQIFLLPPYSPELNPDEMLNNDVKTNALGRRRPRTQDELIDNVREYLSKRCRQPQVVKRYFQESHVRYAGL
jgi:transposase